MIELIETSKPVSSVIGFYPNPETNAYNIQLFEWHYRALHFTYRVNVQMVSAPAQITDLFGGAIVAIEEDPDAVPIEDFEHPDQAVYIAGNSLYQFPSQFTRCTHVVQIPVPDPEHPLYGSQAAAIVLNDRRMKHAD
ncbi:MAG: hypothetical protein ACR2PR_07550 [Pseudohongiellaceae bacterium]